MHDARDRTLAFEPSLLRKVYVFSKVKQFTLQIIAQAMSQERIQSFEEGGSRGRFNPAARRNLDQVSL